MDTTINWFESVSNNKSNKFDESSSTTTNTSTNTPINSNTNTNDKDQEEVDINITNSRQGPVLRAKYNSAQG